MANFIISTNNCADWHLYYFKKNDIHLINIKRIIDGEVKEDVSRNDEDSYQFYQELTQGKLPTTTQINPYEYIEHFNQLLRSNPGKDIIHVSLSSGLSGSYSNALLAVSQINEKLTNCKIYIIDSLGATLAMGMVVEYLLRMRDKNLSTLESLKELEYIISHQQTFASLSDLFHLSRGGRLSPSKALVGSLLHVRPVICLNNVGKLAVVKSLRGFRAVINYLVNQLSEQGFDPQGKYPLLYIIHTSDRKIAFELEEKIRASGIKVEITHGVVGPVIGTHLGLNALGVIFVGKERTTIE